MMTQMSAALVWFAGLIGWYIIRYPFARRAKKIRVSKSLFDWRESSILAFALLGLLVIPAVYALIGFPARLDRPFIPAVAWLGLAPLCAALWLFRRSHVDLGRNWSISLEICEQHALVKPASGKNRRLSVHPASDVYFVFPPGSGANALVTVAEPPLDGIVPTVRQR